MSAPTQRMYNTLMMDVYSLSTLIQHTLMYRTQYPAIWPLKLTGLSATSLFHSLTLSPSLPPSLPLSPSLSLTISLHVWSCRRQRRRRRSKNRLRDTKNRPRTPQRPRPLLEQGPLQSGCGCGHTRCIVAYNRPASISIGPRHLQNETIVLNTENVPLINISLMINFNSPIIYTSFNVCIYLTARGLLNYSLTTHTQNTTVTTKCQTCL